jgi:hypothetical protein
MTGDDWLLKAFFMTLPFTVMTLIWHDGYLKGALEYTKAARADSGAVVEKWRYRFKSDSIREVRRMMAIEEKMKNKPKKKGPL